LVLCGRNTHDRQLETRPLAFQIRGGAEPNRIPHIDPIRLAFLTCATKPWSGSSGRSVARRSSS
jgi:hypothetical protein